MAVVPPIMRDHNYLRIAGLKPRCICRQRSRAPEKLKPDLAEAHNNLGAALQVKGEYDDAIAEYKEALPLTPCRGPLQPGSCA